ncbi:hypothetical protein TNCV_2727481 [Trichonephila clavipes]|nr:hypothetical protein TNCV_2727481 [Trichonephila clavipes]
MELLPETDESRCVNEEVVDFARKIYLEVDSDDVQELLDSHHPELTIDELMKMLEKDIEELESLDPIQSEDQIKIGNFTVRFS